MEFLEAADRRRRGRFVDGLFAVVVGFVLFEQGGLHLTSKILVFIVARRFFFIFLIAGRFFVRALILNLIKTGLVLHPMQYVKET